MRFPFLFLLFVLVSNAGFAQKRSKKADEPTKSSSVEPYYPEANKYVPKAKKSRRKDRGATYNDQQNFYDQRKAVNKKKEKAQRILDDPQYANPTYFGHKRPPKKRKPEDMKFCKVCGIRH